MLLIILYYNLDPSYFQSHQTESYPSLDTLTWPWLGKESHKMLAPQSPPWPSTIYEAPIDLGILHIHILIAPSLDIVPAYLHLNPGTQPWFPPAFTLGLFTVIWRLKTLFSQLSLHSQAFSRVKGKLTLCWHLSPAKKFGRRAWKPESKLLTNG